MMEQHPDNEGSVNTTIVYDWDGRKLALDLAITPEGYFDLALRSADEGHNGFPMTRLAKGHIGEGGIAVDPVSPYPEGDLEKIREWQAARDDSRLGPK